MTVYIKNIDVQSSDSNFKLTVYQFVKVGYEYKWLPLSTKLANGKATENQKVEFFVIGGGYWGSLGRKTYTQLYNLDETHHD